MKFPNITVTERGGKFVASSQVGGRQVRAFGDTPKEALNACRMLVGGRNNGRRFYDKDRYIDFAPARGFPTDYALVGEDVHRSTKRPTASPVVQATELRACP